MKFISIVFLGLFSLACNATPEQKIKASFNCSKASLPVELSICSDPALANLDLMLGKAYKSKRNSISKSDSVTLKKEQRSWLKTRINKCYVRDYNYSSKDVINCLITNYTYRISDLNESEDEKAAYYQKSITKDSYSLDDRRRWRKIAKWPNSCEIRDMRYMVDSGLSFYSITDKKIILKVTCKHYAYQSLDKLYSIEFSKSNISASPLKLPQVKEAGNKWKRYNSNTITGHFQFYAKDRELLNIHKYYGAEQCGHSIVYKIKSKPSLTVNIDKAWGNFDCEKSMTEEGWPEIKLSKIK